MNTFEFNETKPMIDQNIKNVKITMQLLKGYSYNLIQNIKSDLNKIETNNFEIGTNKETLNYSTYTDLITNKIKQLNKIESQYIKLYRLNKNMKSDFLEF